MDPSTILIRTFAALLLGAGPVAAPAQTDGSADPVADYAACVTRALPRIDAYVAALWTDRSARLPALLDAQAEAMACARRTFAPAQAALARDPPRRRALGRHFAKLQSLIASRMPEPTMESRRQYAERVAADDAALARIWEGVAIDDRRVAGSGS